MATGPARENKDNFVLITGIYVPALKRKNLTEKIHMTVYKSRLVYGVHYTDSCLYALRCFSFNLPHC